MHNVERKRKGNGVLIGAILVFLVSVIMIFVTMDSGNDVADDPNVSQDLTKTLEVDGEVFEYNKDLMNILFLGIDKDDVLEEQDGPRTAGQSDCIMILSLNKETKEGRILQIPRDTMTEVDMYDSNGNYYNSAVRQITLQFAFGIGGENSCWAVKKTVSELLYDLPIDGYFAIDMAGVAKITDAIGGVTITVPSDYTHIDPSFEEGATITLNGEQAEKYVRYRDIDQMFSNNDRMERQTQFIPALVDSLKQKVGAGGNYVDLLLPVVDEYMITDLREDQLNDLADYELDMMDIQTLPGEGKMGEVHEEFHVDEEKLLKNIAEMFYISKK